MPKDPQGRWLVAVIVFGPAVFVAAAALGDWALRPSRGWIAAELIVVIALLIGKQLYGKRLHSA